MVSPQVVSRQVTEETQTTEETQMTQELSRKASLEVSPFPTQEIRQELTYRWPHDLTHYYSPNQTD